MLTKRSFRLLLAWTQMIHSRSLLAVSTQISFPDVSPAILWNLKLKCLTECSEEGLAATYGKQTEPRKHLERYFASERVGWVRQALHLVCLTLNCKQSRCRTPPWNAWSKDYGTLSSWIRYLPSPWRTLRPVFRWDHSLGDSFWAWARSSSTPCPWWN
jgi:hypothetical protein